MVAPGSGGGAIVPVTSAVLASSDKLGAPPHGVIVPMGARAIVAPVFGMAEIVPRAAVGAAIVPGAPRPGTGMMLSVPGAD